MLYSKNSVAGALSAVKGYGLNKMDFVTNSFNWNFNNNTYVPKMAVIKLSNMKVLKVGNGIYPNDVLNLAACK